MRGTVILTNFEFSSTIIGKVSHLSGGFSGQDCISLELRAPYGTLHVSETSCPNFEPRAHARLTGFDKRAPTAFGIEGGASC